MTILQRATDHCVREGLKWDHSWLYSAFFALLAYALYVPALIERLFDPLTYDDE